MGRGPSEPDPAGWIDHEIALAEGHAGEPDSSDFSGPTEGTPIQDDPSPEGYSPTDTSSATAVVDSDSEDRGTITPVEEPASIGPGGAPPPGPEAREVHLYFRRGRATS